jgi:hypothetical protein
MSVDGSRREEGERKEKCRQRVTGMMKRVVYRSLVDIVRNKLSVMLYLTVLMFDVLI